MLLGIQSVCFHFRLQDFHLLWCSFQLLRLASTIPDDCPTTPRTLVPGLGCFLFARRYWGNRCLLSLPSATKMFQFAELARSCLYIQQVVRFGLPHSDTLGSLLVSSSPRHFVGHHVLLRLCVPRYPPLALCSLTLFIALCFFWTLFVGC